MRRARRAPHASRRFTAASAVALALVVTGCGGDGGSGGAEENSPLSQEQADTALLTEANLGEGFVVNPDEDEDDSEGLGCLSFIADLGKSEDAATTAEIDYEFESELGNPAVISIIESYDDTDSAEALVETLRGGLEGCDAVDYEDEDGSTFSLDVATDDEQTADGTDDQLNLTASGTIASGGMEFPFTLALSLARVGQHLTMVGVTDLGSSSSVDVDAYTQIAVDRLAAVAAGDEPAETTAPAPTPAS